MSVKRLCLCYLTRVTDNGDAEVLLGAKKTGLGAGKTVGLGGHVEPGETPAQATVREVAEESGIRVDEPRLRDMGVVTYRFPVRPEWDSVVSVFSADRFSGQAEESAEIAPRWYRFDELPLTKMWDDARLWLPRLLSGERVTAEFTFADDCETVADYRWSPEIL